MHRLGNLRHRPAPGQNLKPPRCVKFCLSLPLDRISCPPRCVKLGPPWESSAQACPWTEFKTSAPRYILPQPAPSQNLLTPRWVKFRAALGIFVAELPHGQNLRPPALRGILIQPAPRQNLMPPRCFFWGGKWLNTYAESFGDQPNSIAGARRQQLLMVLQMVGLMRPKLPHRGFP